jgi:hypothetical protein
MAIYSNKSGHRIDHPGGNTATVTGRLAARVYANAESSLTSTRNRKRVGWLVFKNR